MEKVKLKIIGMTYSQSQSGAYALMLGMDGQKKRLPIIIGGNEAQAIAIEIEKMKPARPLTHDLFKNFAVHFNINVNEVIINKFENGIFHSLLVCEHEGEISYVDSRTSDAIALALRFDSPIYTYQEIIDEAGILLESGSTDVGTDPESDIFPIENKQTQDFENILTEQLEDMLKSAIKSESYEEAAKIRDEINSRKKI